MRRQDLVILVIAIVSALLAFVLIANYLKKAASPKLQVIVAAQLINRGHIIVPQDLALSKPMENLNANDFFLQAADLLGMEALSAMTPGEPIYRSKVKYTQRNEAAKADPTFPIGEGLRALTLRAEEVDNLPDYFKSGSYVDILGNITNNDNQVELQTIIRGAQVISVSRMMELLAKDKNLRLEDLPIRSFTLALDPMGIEVVTKAMQKGKIRVIVRPDNQQNEVLKVEGVQYTEIIRGIEKEKVMRNENRYGGAQNWLKRVTADETEEVAQQ